MNELKESLVVIEFEVKNVEVEAETDTPNVIDIGVKTGVVARVIAEVKEGLDREVREVHAPEVATHGDLNRGREANLTIAQKDQEVNRRRKAKVAHNHANARRLHAVILNKILNLRQLNLKIWGEVQAY